MSSPFFTLSDGQKIPALGLGTYKLSVEEANDLIKFALLEAGYRHLDGAWYYANEYPIGQAVKSIIDSGKLKREEIWITSKVWNDKHQRSQVMVGCKESLKNFGLDYLDLFLIHWPMGYENDPKLGLIHSDVDYLETWKGMEDAYKAGLVKSIGVSNFNKSQLERLLANCSIRPTVNQVEVHPYFNNDDLVDYCKSQGILVTAYAPLANVGRVLAAGQTDRDLSKDPVLAEIGSKYGKTWAQVSLRYNYQRGISIIPKSSSKKRLIENISIFDFELTPDEMAAIKAIDKNLRTVTFDLTKDHPLYPFN